MKKLFKNLDLKIISFFVAGKLGFDKEYKQIVRSTRNTLFPFYGLHSESLQEILCVKDELIKETQENKNKEFNTVILMLLNRSIQHLESIFLLAERGLYGDAFGLLRGVLSDINMFYYLQFNPHLIQVFIKESDVSYQTDKEFKSSFNESAIDEDLKNRGIKSVKLPFQILSKTIHASAWGSQLYGKEGKKKNDAQVYHFKYGPGFETKKALALFSIIVSAHFDYLVMILDYRQSIGLDLKSDFWKKVIKHVYKLEPKILSLSDLGEDILLKLNLEKKVNEPV